MSKFTAAAGRTDPRLATVTMVVNAVGQLFYGGGMSGFHRKPPVFIFPVLFAYFNRVKVDLMVKSLAIMGRLANRSSLLYKLTSFKSYRLYLLVSVSILVYDGMA